MSPAYAQSQTALTKLEPSGNLDIEFIFYKLAGSKPDFKKLTDLAVKEDISSMGPENARDLRRKTTNQLKKKFQVTNPAKDRIVVELSAYMEFMNIGEGSENPPMINLSFYPDSQDLPFLIKDLSTLKTNLIVNNFQDFLTLKLDQVELAQLKENVSQAWRYSVTSERQYEVTLLLELKPLSVDTAGPVNIRGEEIWLMMTEMAELQILGEKDRDLLWSARTEWKENEKRNKILNLYNDKSSIEPEAGGAYMNPSGQ